MKSARFRTVFFLATVMVSLLRAEAERKPLLVELFTSEGCSSCPPADAFLRELDKQPFEGLQFLVLEEHVDYWDGDGWRDPFSSHEFTLRQAQYATRMHVDPYTPEMVIDGSYEFVGSDRSRASQAIQKALTAPTIPVRISSVRVENGKLHAQIDSDSVPEKADVLMAVAFDHAASQVLRGENGGQHLQHVAVTTKLVKIGKAEKGSAFSKDVVLEPVKQESRLVVFLQESGQGKVIGAATAQIHP